MDDELRQLTDCLTCTQCGQRFSDRACGPTHALIASDPTRHRLLAPIFEQGRDAGIREVKTAVRSALWGNQFEYSECYVTDAPLITVVRTSVVKDVLDKFGEEPL